MACATTVASRLPDRVPSSSVSAAAAMARSRVGVESGESVPSMRFVRTSHPSGSPGSRVITGVSGGPDSVCLLHVLRAVDYEPVVAHFDHQLRPESVAEAQQVAALAARLGMLRVGLRLSGEYQGKCAKPGDDGMEMVFC